MDWATTMRRLAEVMTPRGQLAIVEHGPRDLPWRDALTEVIRRHSRSRDYDQRFDIVDALSDRRLFEPVGSTETAPMRFRQTIGDYVEHFHSTASLAREHMSTAEAAEFARAVEEIVRPYTAGGSLELPVVASIRWGRPLAP
jgi:hypothetical protein